MVLINNRKILIGIGIFLFILVIIIFAGVLSSSSDQVKREPIPSPYPTNRPIVIPSPKPTTSQTGADEQGEAKFLQDHPQYVIEANLKVKLPIVENGFTVDYSYREDKFTVDIKSPHSQNYNNFLEWMKAQGLSDVNRFIVSYGQ